jgi:hydroxymethylpyrimidine pyrophosphatase-like HAD family hydrolase
MGFLGICLNLSVFLVIGYLIYRFLLLEYRVRLVEHRVYHPLVFTMHRPSRSDEPVHHHHEEEEEGEGDFQEVTHAPVNSPTSSDSEQQEEEPLIEDNNLISAEHLDTQSSRSARLKRMSREKLVDMAKSQGVDVDITSKKMTKGKLIEKILSV